MQILLKRSFSSIPKSFDHEIVEQFYLSNLTKFVIQKQNINSPHFSMILPPPNVTGVLHIGHALTLAIEDSIARYKYMSGYNVSYIPGFDHAGIATQAVVEKLLNKNGIDKNSLTKDEFLEKIHQLSNQHKDIIHKQLEKMGTILDWNSEYFTLNEKHSNSVTSAFIQLYNDKIIYRNKRIVNWCPALQSTISDIEIENEEIKGNSNIIIPNHNKPIKMGLLYFIKYPLENNHNKYITVATTRPETLFGDTALAVNSKDERYQKYIGKYVKNPITNQIIPIIQDNLLVNPKFGTGVVKVTPAHDINDYECGIRNKLDMVNIMNRNGSLNEKCLQFKGMDRFNARNEIIKYLNEKKLVSNIQSYTMTINKCSRSGDIIEPLLLPQWFIDTPPLSSSILESINNNELSIYPSTYKNDCIRWLSHPQPWCISRQIKWGHKIPAYKVIDNNNNNKELGWIVCKNKEDIEKECKNKFNKSINECNIIQDSDVLDTWFSSCILPLSTSNWPNNIDHDKYPLSLMETGSDILFFWVLRQAMLCKKLSNELPFKTVYLHPIVRDSTGRKMSKSLGNVIDPLNVIYGITKEKMINNLLKSNLSAKELEKSIKSIKSQYPNGIESSGLDTLRFCLISYLKQSRSINLDINSIKSSKRFCNKLWNAMKYLEINNIYSVESLSNIKISDNYPLPLHSMWILSRLSDLIESVNINMKNYSFYNVTNELVQFFLHDFCDNYLEFSKVDMTNMHSATTNQILGYTMYNYLLMLTPFMPFITEYLYNKILLPIELRNDIHSLNQKQFPVVEQCKYYNIDIENQFNKILDLLHHIRSFQVLCKTLSSGYSINIKCNKQEVLPLYEEYKPYIESLTNIKNISINENSINSNAVLSYCEKLSDDLSLDQSIIINEHTKDNIKTEIDRVMKKIKKINEVISKTDDLLKNRGDHLAEDKKNEKKILLEKLKTELTSFQNLLDSLIHFRN